MQEMIIRRPDDMHFHPRTGSMLHRALPYTSEVFSRGVVMGNLPESVVTADDAERYQEEILSVAPSFSPIMTIMLTKRTTPQIIKKAFQKGIKVLKYIPGNASTNSQEGIDPIELRQFYSVLKMAENLGMIFSGHWEILFDGYGSCVPELEREIRAICFLDRVIDSFPELKIVVEHVSTKGMLMYVKKTPKNISATLTVHHALLTYSDVCDVYGNIINPHHYCKPIAKSFLDRQAIIETMVSGNPKFFFGSDSAPHLAVAKNAMIPPAGIFTAPVALPLLCELFEENNVLDKLEDFVSRYGAEFYGLPLNQDKIILKKEDWIVPEHVGNVQIFKGGEKIKWKVAR